MMGPLRDALVRQSFAFSARTAGARVGSSRERLPREEDQGILGLAVGEDKALLRSNLSAAAVQ